MKLPALLALSLLPLLSVSAAAPEAAKPPADAKPELLALRVDKDRKASVTLQENVTTGFRWIAKFDPNLCKVEITHRGPENPGDVPLCGAPGKAIITVTLLADGPVDLTLEYRRPWEKDVPPVKVLYYAVLPATGTLPRR